MRTFVLGLIWFMMIFPPFSPALAQDDLELLVLSEIEERIAGKMAFYTLERALTEQGGALTEDPRVTAIGRKLIKYADRPQLNYAFYVIEDHSAPQALSLPGGYVLLARSLLEAVCQTDDDIAFILGHEIAHAALRHYADYRLRNQEQVAYVKQLIEQYNFVGEAEQVKSSAELNNVLLPYMMKIRQLKEVEADQFGALYALRAGYQFSASLDVLARLRNLFGETFELEQYPAAVAEDAAAAPTSTRRRVPPSTFWRPLIPQPFSPREKGVLIPLPPGEGTRVRASGGSPFALRPYAHAPLLRPDQRGDRRVAGRVDAEFAPDTHDGAVDRIDLGHPPGLVIQQY